MKRSRHTPEQVIRKLREAERMLGEGKTTVEVATALEISENTYLMVAAAGAQIAAEPHPLLAVSEWGAPTGFDSGEPRWRKYTDRITIDPTARNSDCQFCSVRFQKSDVVT